MSVTQTSLSETYDEILSTTLKNYRPKMVDNIYGSLPLLYWLNKKGRKKTIDGGEKIAIPLLYGENTTVTEYSRYDIVDVTPQDGITTAFYNWKNVAVSITIDRESERKNSGPHRLVNLFETKVMQAEKSLQWYMNDLLHGFHGSRGKTFTGGDTNTVDSQGGTSVESDSFNSLDHIVRLPHGLIGVGGTGAANGTNTHVVGGITCTAITTGGTYTEWDDYLVTGNNYVNPWWYNYTIPGHVRLKRGADGGVIGARVPNQELLWAGDINAGSPNGMYLVYAMGAMYYRLSTEGDKPDLLLSNADVFGVYENSQIPQERYMNRDVADAGFDNLRFHGATFIYDHGITTQLPTAPAVTTAAPVPLYFLNSKYLEWTVDKGSDFVTTPFVKPANQLARTAQIVLMANLTCSNRSKQGVIACGDVTTDGWTA